MAFRVTHQISSECDVTVEQLGKGHVRIRITERDKDISEPTDFEIEGVPLHIAEACAICASILSNIDSLNEESS